MAEFPDNVFVPRETENLPGIVYDVDQKRFFFSEDFQNLGSEITAIETLLKMWFDFSSLIFHLGSHTETPAQSFSSFPTTADRNNVDISVGYKFNVSSKCVVSRLSRLYVSGNTEDHVVYIFNSSTQAIIAQGTVLASSTSDANGFKWVDISPVSLFPGVDYVLCVDENNGGDEWTDIWDASTFINSAFINLVAYAYTFTHGDYPLIQVVGNNIYGAPAMEFNSISESDVKFGLGTDSPSEVFDVFGRIKADGFLQGDAPLISSQWLKAVLGIYFNGGNVGIGTDNPDYQLTIDAQGALGQNIAIKNNVSGGVFSISDSIIQTTRSDGLFIQYFGGAINFQNGGMTLDVSGNMRANSVRSDDGANGTFTTVDLKTVTVENGIIISIV